MRKNQCPKQNQTSSWKGFKYQIIILDISGKQMADIEDSEKGEQTTDIGLRKIETDGANALSRHDRSIL